MAALQSLISSSEGTPCGPLRPLLARRHPLIPEIGREAQFYHARSVQTAAIAPGAYSVLVKARKPAEGFTARPAGALASVFCLFHDAMH
jgi:hypothetical protein